MVSHAQLNDHDDNRESNGDEDYDSFEGISHQDKEHGKDRDDGLYDVEEYLRLGEDLVISVEQDNKEKQAKWRKIHQHVQKRALSKRKPKYGKRRKYHIQLHFLLIDAIFKLILMKIIDSLTNYTHNYQPEDSNQYDIACRSRHTIEPRTDIVDHAPCSEVIEAKQEVSPVIREIVGVAFIIFHECLDGVVQHEKTDQQSTEHNNRGQCMTNR